MKNNAFVIVMLLMGVLHAPLHANEPDSVYLYMYGTSAAEGRGGLRAAWSTNMQTWNKIGGEFSFLSSDYGTWGSEKRMISPLVQKDKNGLWHIFFSVNERDNVTAYTSSPDLINWMPQDYYKQGERLPVAPAVQGVAIASVMPTAYGTVTKVAREEVRTLESRVIVKNTQNALFRENADTDTRLFGRLEPLTATLSLSTGNSYPISDKLIGIFFEDISRAADGGLYAELIQNRDFEYTSLDKREWNAKTAWTLVGDGGQFAIDTIMPIHNNNRHYAVLRTDIGGAAALQNKGFEGIAVKKGEKYNLSLFVRQLRAVKSKLKVSILSNDGKTVIATTTLPASPDKWKKQTAVLTASADAADAILEVRPLSEGLLCLDMVSLFPQKTFKGRTNGLRADLAQVIADMKPQFVRFPGGCVAHGNGLHNMYRWKNTIGALEERVPQSNIWGYHQSAGLGYYEYFLFSEDIGAEPLPVVPAGVPCQNSSRGGAGQQGGIPMDEMDEYVQEVLDLIEYANGDAKTTKYGRMRAAAGHPAPFNLKYVGIGNEDLISTVFKERFEMIYKAVREKYPEIIPIGTVGPFWEGSDYDEGWRFATELEVPVVDEHYYVDPGWYIHNQNYYDNYDRSKPHVYLGEYASRGNTLYNALSEAIHLCNVERNGDVVEMTSYAPLLAKEGQTNWNPDLIYFTNTEVHPTPNYYVQMLFGQNSGTTYLPSTLNVETRNNDARLRVVHSVVRAANGDLIIKLVNMLPTSVSVNIGIPDAPGNGVQAAVHTLTGAPKERTQTLMGETMTLRANEPVTLSPYSLTVIRAKELPRVEAQ